MVPENWDKLKEIFSAAIALAPTERPAYLERACGEDLSLRTAVESLIESHQETANFVDKPAYKAAAEMILKDDEDQTGRTIAHYRIRSLLGAGGMGKVYLAEDKKLKRNVALKVLPSVSAGDEAARNRLLREARAAAALDHPNICAIHEVGDVDGISYIAMQYIDGETLDVRLKRGPLKCDEALLIATQIADGLSEAHSLRLVHRDIKPANIILNRRGQAKVLDFGLAKSAVDPSLVHTEAETEELLSTPGTLIGTVPYMSPEQVRGEALDPRSDTFSFGVLLYEMLTGRQLFAAGSAVATISAILTKEPEPIGGACPEDLKRIVHKCLAKDREQRYQTMGNVLTDLRSVGQGLASESAEVLPNSDLPTEIIKIPYTGKDVKPHTFVSSRVRWVIASVALLVAVISVYELFIKGSRGALTTSAKSVNSPAYDSYLRGKVNVGSENRDSNETAIKLLEQAIEGDPNFAPAYAELARAYYIKAFYFASDAEKKKLNENAEVALEKSLTLNPNLAEGHFVRGLILWSHANRFPHDQSIQSYKHAIALNPDLDEAHHQLGLVYLHIGLLDKAWEEIEKAVAINPGNTLARFRFGVINMYRTRYDEALAFFNSTPLDKNPALWSFQKASALFQLGRTQEASDIVEEYLKNYSRDEGGTVTSVKAMILAKAGKEHEAEATIQRAVEIGKGFGHFHHTAYNIASAYALLNKPEPAIKWLQVAAEDGFPCYPLFEKDANLNSLRKDDRFIAFMAKLKEQWERYNATL